MFSVETDVKELAIGLKKKLDRQSLPYSQVTPICNFWTPFFE